MSVRPRSSRRGRVDVFEPLGFRTDFRPKDRDDSEQTSGRHRSIHAEHSALSLQPSTGTNLSVDVVSSGRTYRVNRGGFDEDQDAWPGFSVRAHTTPTGFGRRQLQLTNQWISTRTSADTSFTNSLLDAGPEESDFWLAAPKTTDLIAVSPTVAPAGLAVHRLLGERSLEGKVGQELLDAMQATAVRVAALSAAFIIVGKAALHLDVDPEEFDIIDPRIACPAGVRVPVLQFADRLVNGAGLCATLGQSDPASGESVIGRLVRNIIDDAGQYPLTPFGDPRHSLRVHRSLLPLPAAAQQPEPSRLARLATRACVRRCTARSSLLLWPRWRRQPPLDFRLDATRRRFAQAIQFSRARCAGRAAGTRLRLQDRTVDAVGSGGAPALGCRRNDRSVRRGDFADRCRVQDRRFVQSRSTAVEGARGTGIAVTALPTLPTSLTVPERLSPSLLGYWSRCVLKLIATSGVNRTVVPRLPVGPDAEFGTIVHQSIERAKRGDSDPLLWFEQALDSRSEELAHGEIPPSYADIRLAIDPVKYRNARELIESHTSSGTQGRGKTWNVPRRRGLEVGLESEALGLSGRADQIRDHDDGSVEIVDFKTGGVLDSDGEINPGYALQLRAYALMFSSKNRISMSSSRSTMDRSPASLLTLTRSMRHAKLIGRMVSQLPGVGEIVPDEFATPGPDCASCDVRASCQSYRLAAPIWWPDVPEEVGRAPRYTWGRLHKVDTRGELTTVLVIDAAGRAVKVDGLTDAHGLREAVVGEPVHLFELEADSHQRGFGGERPHPRIWHEVSPDRSRRRAWRLLRLRRGLTFPDGVSRNVGVQGVECDTPWR